MIQITSQLDVKDKEAVRAAVNAEVQKLDKHLLSLKMQPTTRMEANMVREYLHAKLRGLLDANEG